MKKILSLLLVCTLTLLTLTACGGAADDTVPAGMKAATDPSIHKFYTMYVPASYIVDMSTGITSAYVSTIDHSNVSMTYEVPKQDNLREYFEAQKLQLAKLLEDFTVIEENVVQETDGGEEAQYILFGGLQAAKYTYEGVYNGTKYRFLQYLIPNGSYVFIFTYTGSLQEDHNGELPFYKNLSDVEKIIDAFQFH